MRGDVVTGVLPPASAQVDGVFEELRDGPQAGVDVADLSIIDAEDEIDQFPERGTVADGDAQQVGDHLEGQIGADGFDEVEFAPLPDCFHDLGCKLTHVVRHLPDRPGRERDLHQSAVLLMLGVIHRDDRAEHLQQFGRHVVQRETPRAGETRRIPGHRAYRGVGRDRPEAGSRPLRNELDPVAALAHHSECGEACVDVAVPERTENRRIGGAFDPRC